MVYGLTLIKIIRLFCKSGDALSTQPFEVDYGVHKRNTRGAVDLNGCPSASDPALVGVVPRGGPLPHHGSTMHKHLLDEYSN